MGLYQTTFPTDRADGLGPDFAVTTTATTGVGLIAVDGSALSDTTSLAVALLTSSPAASADQAAQLTCSSTTGVHAVLLRASGTAASLNAYSVAYFGSSLQIRRWQNGSPLNLVTLSRPKAAGDVIRATVEGDKITAFVNGAPLLTATHAGITAAGSLGILASTAKSTRSRSFYAGDLADFASVPTGGAPIATKPGQVTGLMAGTPSQGDVPLSWAPLVGAADYIVEVQATGATVWTALPPVTEATAQLAGLATGTYKARVTARNTSGSGTPSAAVDITIQLVVRRTLQVPLLDTDDRLPERYMPETVATRADLAAAAAALAGYQRVWAANTAYTQGAVVVSPAGQLVQAKATFTSGATYNAASWTILNPPAVTGPASGPPLDGWTPTITVADTPVATVSQFGMSSMYLPWLIQVPDSVYAAYPQYGRWRIYNSTDHDVGAGGLGVMWTDAVDPTAPGTTWTFGRFGGSAKMFVLGSGDQVETPAVRFNPVTSLFHCFYQRQSPTDSTVQYTEVITSADGITGWSAPVVAMPNPTGTAPWNHTGVAHVWLIDGLWVARTLLGSGGTGSTRAWWYSYDGIRFVMDRRTARRLHEFGSGFSADYGINIAALFRAHGRLWNIAHVSNPGVTAGAVPTWTKAMLMCLRDDLRSAAGRPRELTVRRASGTVITNFPVVYNWVPLPDGRLVGAGRNIGASDSSHTVGLVTLS